MPEITFLEAINQALLQEMRADETVFDPVVLDPVPGPIRVLPDFEGMPPVGAELDLDSRVGVRDFVVADDGPGGVDQPETVVAAATNAVALENAVLRRLDDDALASSVLDEIVEDVVAVRPASDVDAVAHVSRDYIAADLGVLPELRADAVPVVPAHPVVSNRDVMGRRRR